MPNFWTETHKERWARKEVVKEALPNSKRITEWITILLLSSRRLSCCLLLSLFLFFLLQMLMMISSHFINSMLVRLAIQVLSRSIIDICSVQVNWSDQGDLTWSFNILYHSLSALIKSNPVLLICFLLFLINILFSWITQILLLFLDDLYESFATVRTGELSQGVHHLIVLLLAYVAVVSPVDHSIRHGRLWLTSLRLVTLVNFHLKLFVLVIGLFHLLKSNILEILLLEP